MKKLILVLSLLGVSFCGCTMIPHYAKPDFAAASNWNDIPDYATGVGKKTTELLRWNEFFKDSELQQVIGQALENNRNLHLAVLKIKEARALYRIKRAGMFPESNANFKMNAQKSSDESSLIGKGKRSKQYDANVGFSSYELDVFGRVRSQDQSALNEYLSTREGKEVVQNALIAETANAYLQLLADQKLLALTQKILDTQQRTYDIFSESRQKGVATKQNVARAQTAVEAAKVNRHRRYRFVEQDKNALILLMGVSYKDGPVLVKTLSDINLPDNFPIGLPSEVLLNRPDVRQAEFELLARNADIGAARAAFFPSISLTGEYGFASQDLASLFTDGALGVWSFIPRLTLPIFRYGSNKNNLDLAKIRKEKAAVNYEQVIQTAFREVSDELVARVTLGKELNSQKRLVKAAQRVYEVSDARYKSGLDSLLSVLEAQRELYTYQQNEIELERQSLSNFINLYKVLGGGISNKINR